ncbi:MAG: ESX secretion-associated protein EspG [Nocardia sp.]|nr:ESX secretion-associated protein EspG [Nocardia sp.]
MSEWHWDPDDFAALWLSAGNDRLPGLLRYTSRFAYENDFAQHRHAVRERYDADELELIETGLRTLDESGFRIEILGGTSRYRGSDGSVRVYRIIGARTPERAAVLHQFTQGDRDGLIRLRLCRPDQLAARIGATIPPSDAGTQHPITVHPADLREARRSATGNAPHERYHRMMKAVEGGGSATLHVGAFNTDPKPWKAVQWHDISDGRYIELHTEHITVRPLAPRDLTARFDTWLELGVDHLQEQQPGTW